MDPQRMASDQDEALLFGLTPPRRSTPPDQVQWIAKLTLDRLRPLNLDGLALYDIDDESDRNPAERPFPYLPTLDPAAFYDTYLTGWKRPVVIYRSVGKYQEAELRSWLHEQDANRVRTVFVGASSGQKAVRTDLTRAQSVWRETRPDLPLGGVAIPERHSHRDDEHLRILTKQRNGCSFFVTQVVYDVNATKNLVSDYCYACAERGIAPVPIVFTLSVCGSLKTLEFLQWLGVDVPGWMQNALRNADDPLSESYEQCVASAADLMTFCRRLKAPFGFNVESVSIRKAEIDASVRLAAHLRERLA